MIQISSRFAALLGTRKTKISDVSRQTDISRTTLTKLYYGDGIAVSFAVLAKLCDALNCDITDILEVKRGVGNG